MERESTNDRPWDGESVTFSRKTPKSSSAKYSMSCNLGYFLLPLLLAQKLPLLASRMTSRSCFELISLVSMGGQEDYGSQPHPKMNSEKRLLPVSWPEPSQSADGAVSPTSPKNQQTGGSSWYKVIRKIKDEKCPWKAGSNIASKQAKATLTLLDCYIALWVGDTVALQPGPSPKLLMNTTVSISK